MKQNLLYIFIITVFVSCTSDKYKTQLLGNWYFYNKPVKAKHLNEFKIYRDSVVINDFMGRTTAKWKANEKQIYLYDIKGFHDRTELTYEYKLKDKHLLDLKVYGDSIIEFKNIIKANDAFDFLQKSIKLKIDLPKTKKYLKQIGNSEFSFTIYAGYIDEQLMFKTDISPNLNNINNEISDFKKELNPLPISKARFNLITDKNIAKSKIDSLKNILNQTSIKRIIRIFKNDSIDYKNNLIWYGKTE